jgi:hypothetical protein
VFASIHNVLAGTPVENIVAMIDAVKEFNGQVLSISVSAPFALTSMR